MLASPAEREGGGIKAVELLPEGCRSPGLVDLLLLLLGGLVVVDQAGVGLFEAQLGGEIAQLVVPAHLAQDLLQDHLLAQAQPVLKDQDNVLLIGLWKKQQKESPSPSTSGGGSSGGGSSGAPADLRSPEQSYHWPPSSWLMWSCERRRMHSSSEV